MPNFCIKVMQTFLKQKSEIFTDRIYKIILGNGWHHIFLIVLKCIVSLISYHEKYHFLLELLSNSYLSGIIDLASDCPGSQNIQNIKIVKFLAATVGRLRFSAFETTPRKVKIRLKNIPCTCCMMQRN